MKRVYQHKGFEITVDIEPVMEVEQGVTVLPPKGYVAIVDIRTAGATRPTVAPLHLTADSERLFASPAEALMAGCSAGQRLVDDILAP